MHRADCPSLNAADRAIVGVLTLLAIDTIKRDQRAAEAMRDLVERRP